MFPYTRSSYFTLLAVGASCFCLASSIQAQNLVSNGSFESPGFTVPNYYRYLSDGSTIIDSWVASDDGVGERSYWARSGNTGNNTYQVFDGDYSVYINQGTSLSTTFATQTGTTYHLSFWSVSDGTRPITEYTPLKVNVAGFTTTFTNPNGIQDFQFTATSTDSVANLTFINDSSAGDFKIYLLDKVSISPVPAPSAIAAFAIGTVPGGMVLLRRRRKA